MTDPPAAGPAQPEATQPKAAAPAASPPWFADIWARIKDHKVIQWGVGYFAAALALAHAQELIAQTYKWPEIVGQIFIGVLVLGFLVALVLAWYHGHRGLTSFSKAEMSILATLLIVGAGMVVVFVKPAEHAPSAAMQAAAQQRPGGISVAVLPFVNLSGDATQEFFSDGTTEEITSALAKVSGLNVIGRTSAFQFKGANKDLRAIGQALGANHLIEGSVRKAGDKVRIFAQLINADDGTHLWSENYNREIKDVFAVQEEIATAIASALRVPLGLKAGQSLVAHRTADTESYQDYLRAKTLVRMRGWQPLSDAATLLEKVVAEEPAVGLEQQAQPPGHAVALPVGDERVLRRRQRLPQGRADALQLRPGPRGLQRGGDRGDAGGREQRLVVEDHRGVGVVRDPERLALVLHGSPRLRGEPVREAGGQVGAEVEQLAATGIRAERVVGHPKDVRRVPRLQLGVDVAEHLLVGNDVERDLGAGAGLLEAGDGRPEAGQLGVGAPGREGDRVPGRGGR